MVINFQILLCFNKIPLLLLNIVRVVITSKCILLAIAILLRSIVNNPEFQVNLCNSKRYLNKN